MHKEMNNKMKHHGMRMIQSIDCHAGGEPARVIISGLPSIPGNTMTNKREYIMNNMDELRQLLLLEPRGYPCQNANLIFPSSNDDAKFGFVIMEQNKIYPAMSGHNCICVATALLETGMVPMIPDNDIIYEDGSFYTTFNLEAPSGIIKIVSKCKGNKALEIQLTNTASFMDPIHQNIPIKLPFSISEILSHKSLNPNRSNMVNIDIAFGGMWYVIIDSESIGNDFELLPSRGKDIVKLGEIIKVCAQEQYPVNLNEYLDSNGNELMEYIGPDILCFTGKSRYNNDRANAVVMSNNKLEWNKPETFTGMIDRSPCGTGTCAVMASRYAKNEMNVGDTFNHESILGTVFKGVIKSESNVYRKCDNTKIGCIIPEIHGNAWITQYSNIVLDNTDPFPNGFTVGDIW